MPLKAKQETQKKHNQTTKQDCKSTKVSQPPESEEEVWDLIRVLPKQEDCACRTNECQGRAVATWASNLEPDDKWDLCEQCQEGDFGGWPDGVHPEETQDEASTANVPHVSQTQDELSASSSNETCNQETAKGGDPALLDTATTSPSDKNELTSSPSAVTSMPESSTTTQADEGSNDGQPSEVWDLKKILSLDDLTKDAAIKCSTDDCRLPACCIWVSNFMPTTKWYSCLDCQERDFGGWPPLNEMPVESMDGKHLQVIANKCSTNKNPTMPSVSAWTTSPSAPSSQLDKTNSAHFVTPSSNSRFHSKDKGAMGEGKKVTPGTGRCKPNPKALAIHSKWQAAAEAIGGKDARIVVSKPAAKKLIFDILFEAFRPMNIAQIYKAMKAIIPSPVLSACLQEMALDKNDDKNPFDLSDEEQEEEEKPPSSSSDPFSGSLLLKLGKNQGTSLYYVAHNKLTGLDQDQRNTLLQNIAMTTAEEESLKDTLKSILDHATKLLSEPTNEYMAEQLVSQEATVDDLRNQLDEAQKLKVNEKHKQKTKRKIQNMAAQWRKRKRLCMDFLIAMEENTDGTVRAKKCLAGDGQIALDSDENVAQAAVEFAKKKLSRKFKAGNPSRKVLGVNLKVDNNASTSLSDDSFVAVNLDSQYNISRVYVGDE